MIPIFAPSITKLEKSLMADALESGWISGAGEYVDLAEAAWAAECDAKYAVGVTNGTVAIQLLLHALGVGAGDEVIVSNLTYVATANAILHVGATPVFVDVDPVSWCVAPALVEQAITLNTKAILVTHLMGHPCDADGLRVIANRYGLALVGDAAQAHFATYKGTRVGGLLDAETFSFHVGKLLTCGEGGMITTNNKELADRLTFLKNHGMHPNRRFFHPEPAFNFRLTNTHAALLYAQIRRKEELLARRWEIFELYDQFLSEIEVFSMRPIADFAKLSPWVYALNLNTKGVLTTNKIISALASDKIESRPMYLTMNTMPMFSQNRYVSGSVSESEKLADSVFYLPTYFDLKNQEVVRVCNLLTSLVM